jgi:conjugative relaxase-like TrwC/TraI family protein
MLRFTPIQDAGAAAGYYGKTDGGYYLDGPELHREVGGRGAGILGLLDKPDFKQFERLLNGLHPLTGERLTARLVEDRVAGWDMTASVPKGVTEAVEGGDERVRDALWQAVREAAEDVQGLVTTRVRKGGRQEDRLTGNMIWYAFEHPETRPTEEDGMPRPDRHIHVVIPSVTLDPSEGQWKAIKWRPVVSLRKYFSHRFDLRLSTKLTELGYRIETVYQPDEKGGRKYYTWDIAGMPASMLAKDSARHQEIEQLAGKLGKTHPLEKARLGATSRRAKRKDMTLSDYREFWNSLYTPQEIKARDECIRRAMSGENPNPAPATAEAARFAIAHEFYRRPVVDYTALEVTAMERMMGRGRPEELAAEFKKQGVLRVGDKATTVAIHQQESFLIRFTRQGKGKKRPVVPEPVNVGRLLGPSAPGQKAIELSDQQERALAGLAGSRDVVTVVDAGQGTGKTTMLGRYGTILARRNVRTTWLGTTHTAVDELTREGLPAMTLAHFLASKEEQRKAAGSRIILDEASMLAQGDAYRLAQYAKANGCRLDLIGDSKQYKSPVGGNPLGLLTRFADVVPITMTKTMRQQGRLKEAMEAIRDGQVLDGHDMLRQLGMVKELPLSELAQKAAELYLEWTASGESVPVISPTHAQADDISARIRQGLKGRGELKGEDRIVRRLVNLNWTPAQVEDAKKHGGGGATLLRYGAYREDMVALAIGERVRTTMGGTTLDGKHRLRAGRRYQIKGFTKTGDPILSNGWVVDKGWGGLSQDYVRTGQGSQGITENRAIVVYGTPSLVATRQEGFYVPVSRVRHEVAVLTDSNEELREAIQRQDTRQSATELLASPQVDTQLLQRLRQHQEYLRRQAVFAETHRRPTPGRRQDIEREAGYGR